MEQFFKTSYVDKYTSVVNSYYSEVGDAEMTHKYESNMALKL
jgi:hypothetical protein